MNFVGGDLSQTNLTGADLRGAQIRGANLTGADLSRANLSRADFSEAHLIGADLGSADLGAANLTGAHLREACLIGADLRNADLGTANLIGVDLRRAKAIQTNFSHAQLIGADLRKAKAMQTNFSQADLTEAHLSSVDFTDANLRGANLSESDLSGANLSSADLRGADLSGADLSGADLNGADLTEARIGYCNLVNLDLSKVKGLDKVKHDGPSEISVSTIVRSRGMIPLEFLRGVGIPGSFMAHMGSLVGTTSEYYSCFISHSTKDEEFAERLYTDLQAHSVRCWYAPSEGQGGRKLKSQIEEAIGNHEKLLLILSADSIQSAWVRTEIKRAAQLQAQKERDVLFPVSLVPYAQLRAWECWDGDLVRDLAAEIREYLIPDFSRWKEHDSYQKAFEKLLNDLRSGKTRAAAASA